MEESKQKRIVLRRTRQKRSKEETAGFVLVITTGALAVLLGGFYMARHVGQPFDINYVGPQFLTTAEQEEREIEAQKTRDTDGDRISDFDELYVIRTSPYLFDTDGDGIDDLAELEGGTDPTCIEGSDCTDSTFVNPYAESEGTLIGIDELIDTEPVQEPQDVDEIIDNVSTLSPQQIRDLLISSGATEEEVSQFSDDELIALYESVIRDLEGSGELEELLQAEEPTQ